MPFPAPPGFGKSPLPTDAELKILRTAREAADQHLEIIIATRTYVERFGAADALVRDLMFQNPAINNPAFKEFLARLQVEQVLHDSTWTSDYDNNRDLLLPDPNAGPTGETIAILKLSGAPAPRQPPAPDTLDGIRNTALNNQDAKIAVQRVRDAFYALDDAVRAEMKKDPPVQSLIEKFPFLLYGRTDLGFVPVSVSGG